MSKSMKLSEYFEKIQGIGVLATTDASGQVNQAIYSRPHFLDDMAATDSKFVRKFLPFRSAAREHLDYIRAAISELEPSLR